MHRYVLLFVGVAAALSIWAIAEAQVRTAGIDQLFAPDPYLPVIRTTSLGLWIMAAMSVATREVRWSMAKRQAEQVDLIVEAHHQVIAKNAQLVKIVTGCTEALLQDVDQKKRDEINSMLNEYGIDTTGESLKKAEPPTENESTNLLAFRRYRSSGDV
jgi:hypothetical protein